MDKKNKDILCEYVIRNSNKKDDEEPEKSIDSNIEDQDEKQPENFENCEK
jgi:hypothetical protein